MKALNAFALSVACLFPVLLSLDPWTPPVFLLLAAVLLLVRRPDHWWALLLVLAGATLLAWWIFVANVLWTKGGDAVERSLLLALRAWALTGISASFALSVRPAELLSEAMQLAGLPARVGFALYTALNTLPRLREEQKHLRAVHRVRRLGRAAPVLVEAITLLARAIRSAERSAMSLAARGVEKPGPRTWYRPLSWTRADTVHLGAGLSLVAAAWTTLILLEAFQFGFY